MNTTSDHAFREFELRCRQLLALADDVELQPEAMIGFFQRFRSEPFNALDQDLEHLFAHLPDGDDYLERLRQLFHAAGNDRRPEGGRDAYFIVRQPPQMTPDQAEAQTHHWLISLRELANRAGSQDLIARLADVPKIRILEGKPPKQPKSDIDLFPLLRVLKVDAAQLTDNATQECSVAFLMRDAYYYVACDWALRDYLLWPSYKKTFDLDDPHAGYFELWRHGVKYRVFHDDMIDIYLPR